MPLKEKILIQRIRRATAQRGARPDSGIGDDCAVLRIPAGHEVLVTTDFSLEGVHFRREWHPADSVGHRCLTRGLSDIAAMGGVPRAAFLSLALPPDLPQKWVDQFISGLLKLAARYSVPLAGGDTAQSPDGILADIMVVGSVPARKAVLRSGAKPGDLIYVTGTLGSSTAALSLLREGKKLRPRSHPKHFYPEPRLAVGQFLREKKLASAMIDISDGLSTDLNHICEESKVGAIIYQDRLFAASAASSRLVSQHGSSQARHRATSANSRFVSGHDPSAGSGQAFSRAERRSTITRALAPATLDLALHGGEEYELLFTAHPNRPIPRQIGGLAITCIGEIVRGSRMRLVTAGGRNQVLKPAGWEHFR